MSAQNDYSLQAPFSPLKRFWRLVAIERKAIINIYIFAIFAGIISLSLPLGIQAIFNYVSKGQITTSWVVLVAIVILGVILNGILQVFQMSVAERLQQRIFTHSALEFAFRIPRLKMDAIRSQFAPELVNRFFDTLTIQKGFAKILLDISASSLQILFGLILLSFYHPFFILFSLFLIGFLFFVIRVTGPNGLKTSLMESKYKYKVVYWLEEMARTLETFKLAGNTDLTLSKTDEMLDHYLDARKGHFRVLLTKYGVILISKALIIAAMLIIGSLLVYSNELNIGQFVAMEIVVILLISAVEKLIMSMETIYDVLTALEKIASVTDLPLESDEGADLPKTDVKGGIELKIKNLNLSFPDESEPVIRNVDLELVPGDRAILLTTDETFISHFFRVMSGFYDGYSGSISLNGLPLQNISLRDLRTKTGGYTTSTEIFEGSIFENITVGNPDVPMDRVLAITKAVGLNEYVNAQKSGFDTQLHTGGEGITEPIRRKLILGRSLAAHPELLLLNSPFTGFSELEIKQFFSYLDKNMPKTTIILARKEPLADNNFLIKIPVENQSINYISKERK